MNNAEGAKFRQVVKDIVVTQHFIRGLPLRIFTVRTPTGL